MTLSYPITSSTEQIELRPRQVEDGLAIPRHHKRSSSSSSFVYFKAPPLQTDAIIEETSLPNELYHLASQVMKRQDLIILGTDIDTLYFLQALPSLLISVVGLVFAGWMMDVFQVSEGDLVY